MRNDEQNGLQTKNARRKRAEQKTASIVSNGMAVCALLCIVIGIPVTAVVGFVWLSSLGGESTDCQARDAWAVAAVIIEDHAREKLRAPDSANFPFFKPRHVGGGRYSATSYLDTVNVFGGPVRLHFVAEIQCTPLPEENDRGWRITSFRFL